MSDADKPEGIEKDSSESPLKHQITCAKCGMVYEIRYISEHCRMVEGEGYLCMNCNAVLALLDGAF